MGNKKTLTKIRLYAMIFLVLVIISMAIIIVIKKDTIFRYDITVTYPDQCVEKYVNGDLVTPECTEGRQLQERGANPIWNILPENLILNPNLTNLTTSPYLK